MTPSGRAAACLLAVSLLLVCEGLVCGQPRPGKPERQRLRNLATVKAVQGNLMQVVLDVDANQLWLIKIDAKPDAINYTGTAEPSWLQPGMPVRFTTELNKKLVGQQPISELAVAAPREGYRFGVVRDDQLGGGAFELKGDDEPAPRKPSAVDTYFVYGQLRSIREGKMLVAAGRAAVRAELADDVQIAVDWTELRFVRPGDRAKLEGYYYQKGQAIVTRIEVTAAQPLVGPEPKRRPPRPAPPPADEPEDEPDDEPAGQDAESPEQ